jgi:ubiquitin carboxyl-terminal hydrolase 36/42
MCELEQHVMMLRESGGPLSLSKILFHIRSINCQIGDGSQEDAHEFLRFVKIHHHHHHHHLLSSSSSLLL